LAPFLGALWLLGLFAAAPLLRSGDAPYGFTDRLRDALVLGVAIPFVLAFAHLLYWWALWLALIACVIGALRRRTGGASADEAPYVLIAAIAMVAWPSLMRPVLDGDSLSYHLPNAAAWVYAHGFWTTDPRYWWYPPASEVFASALYAVSGAASTPWSGLGPLLLLGFRLYAWARTLGASGLLADALAAAVVTLPPVALQAGSLQNDVWLAAFFVEMLWNARQGNAAETTRTAAVTALIKPYGIAFALVAALAGRATARTWIAAIAAFALWALHDALLWNASIIAPQATSYGNGGGSTIVAHGAAAIALLAVVAVRASPLIAIALLAALFGPLLARRAATAQDVPSVGERRLRWSRPTGWCALFGLLFYLVMPLGYSGPGPQLATGASLRYAAPAMALGGLILVPWLLPAPVVAAIALLAGTVFQAAKSVALFSNDLPTLAAPAVALAAVAVVALARRLKSAWPIAAGIAVTIVASGILAERMPAAYYADALEYGGARSGVYAWIARRQPAAVAGNGLALGTVNVLSPHTRTLDLSDAATCETARAQGALLVAVAESTRTAQFDAARLRAARACGTVLYDDGIAVVSEP
jgi:hypothetical protein